MQLAAHVPGDHTCAPRATPGSPLLVAGSLIVAFVVAAVAGCAVYAGRGGPGDTSAAWGAAFLLLAGTVPTSAGVLVLAMGLLIEVVACWRDGWPAGRGRSWMAAGAAYAAAAYVLAEAAHLIATMPGADTSGAGWTADILSLGAWLPGMLAGPLFVAGFAMEFVPVAQRRLARR